MLPRDVKGDAALFATHPLVDIGLLRGDKTSEVREMAAVFQTELDPIREAMTEDEPRTRAKLHISFAKQLLGKLGMGGGASINQLLGGFSTTGDLAEPGVLPLQPIGAPSLPRDQLLRAVV